ncbi:NAD-dependent glutamate dehydrogenase [Gordonia rhizosphera NBRC 16068]|uniref:NAD-dependent glutamate dehydrogenase n=2 Tax=Gordonia rhizosphera TaxID=83341 RepID=K6WG91_9ACTN|nr:NAD-dependent glutamate dehydrogenase [Gordonia rhizosphera NBRC 16068]
MDGPGEGRDGASDALDRAAAQITRGLNRPPGAELIDIGERGVDIITDDLPDLVSAVLTAIDRAGGRTARVIHPVLHVERDPSGVLLGFRDPQHGDAEVTGAVVPEAWISVEFLSGASADTFVIQSAVESAVAEARAVGSVSVRIGSTFAEVASRNDPEHGGMLGWLAGGNFSPCGYRKRWAGTDRPVLSLGAEIIGMLPTVTSTTIGRTVGPIVLGGQPGLLVAVPEKTESGETLIHEFVGSLTVAAHAQDIADIPVLSAHLDAALAAHGCSATSHTGRIVTDTATALPREELLADDGSLMAAISTDTLVNGRSTQVGVYVRPSLDGRLTSYLVTMPTSRYSSTKRDAFVESVARGHGGAVVTSGVYGIRSDRTVVHVDLHATSNPVPTPEHLDRLRGELTGLLRTWDDHVKAALAKTESRWKPEELDGMLAGTPETYRARAGIDRVDQVVEDLRRIMDLAIDDVDMRLYSTGVTPAMRATIYLTTAAPLSRLLPALQHLGADVLDEHPAMFTRSDGTCVWVHDLGIDLTGLLGEVEERRRDDLVEAFRAAWRGRAESDRFSRLTVAAGLRWREVVVLRAYARYARQIGSVFDLNDMADTLVAQHEAARLLVDLFRARFEPDLADRQLRLRSVAETLDEVIERVSGLDDDRILRCFRAMIDATLRTNWFRDRGVVSFKIDPSGVPRVPAPVPQFEIYVYAPGFEGVHLRFGHVARGGLRHSDRLFDYRTEILGLVKAQAVKNSVIVPVGAKGGFVVRQNAHDLDHVRDCYRGYIGGLLDITDNRETTAAGEMHLVPPDRVVRHDTDDPYLVVAADKGTAAFSDTANDVARSYGFWLGDAFASGGSVGYDHKAMGITARGAWESVKRHLGELDVDPERDTVTVVGIGDMSGDVFGNGMLLSDTIELIAAFDHRHVFLDPTPDPARAHDARDRLFRQPRSSWDDYDRSALSAGGGVWSRSAKRIPISPQVRGALGLGAEVTSLSPNDLIRAILCAPVDLLWNGGVGTYVKASAETHADAGDKFNDAVRVDASELRVRVIGEGGNLGLTQRARIEFARRGGRLNTDAIDNSAGVDCSDHEVNLKVLLDDLVRTCRIDVAERNSLLSTMTDDVADRVLAENRRQNHVLGLARARAHRMVTIHEQMVADLEARTGLDRALAALPTAAEFDSLRAQEEGLCGPELATLLAHTKLDLKARLLESSFPDSVWCRDHLLEYFPAALVECFADAIVEHPLRREIIATMLVNEMVDGAGIGFAYRLEHELGTTVEDAVRAYRVAIGIHDLPALWQRLWESPLPVAEVDSIILDTRELIDRTARRVLTARPQPVAIGAEIRRYRQQVDSLRQSLPDVLTGDELGRVTAAARLLGHHGIDDSTAWTAVSLLHSFALLDVIDIAERLDPETDVVRVAAAYHALGDILGVSRLLAAVDELPHTDRWDNLARLALRDDLYRTLAQLTAQVCDEVAASAGGVQDCIENWTSTNKPRLQRFSTMMQHLSTLDRFDVTTLTVTCRQLAGLVR